MEHKIWEATLWEALHLSHLLLNKTANKIYLKTILILKKLLKILILTRWSTFSRIAKKIMDKFIWTYLKIFGNEKLLLTWILLLSFFSI